MSVLLPAGLPAGFTLEAATGAHAPEVFEVVAAEEVEAFGFCPDSLEDVRAELEPTASTAVQLVVRDPEGSVVQWWMALTEPGDPTFHAFLASHPGLAADVHDELSAAGWAALLGWIREHAPEGTQPLEVRSGCPAGSAAGRRRLADAGFTHRRTFWEMLGQVTEETRAAPPVPGLTITATDDTRAVHAVFDQGFEDHWGFVAVPYDDWMSVHRTYAGYDPALWFLAELDGTPAAAMTLSRRVEAEGVMYVQELATLPEYRRRGIASALLAHAFDQAGRAGLGRLSLHVDSENTHDAPSVYRRAGLQVRCAFEAHVLDLERWPPGSAGSSEQLHQGRQ
jgi:ribosomal protein S18 acetylase RimI-like enzyme